MHDSLNPTFVQTAPWPPALVGLLRALGRRWSQTWRGGGAIDAAPLLRADDAAFAELDAHTLRDIGAPEWLRESRRVDPLWRLERARW